MYLWEYVSMTSQTKFCMQFVWNGGLSISYIEGRAIHEKRGRGHRYRWSLREDQVGGCEIDEESH